MRMYLKWVLNHVFIFIIASFLYMLLFQIDFLNFTGIYFYDGIIRLVILAICLLVSLFLIKKKIIFDYKDIILSLCVVILTNMLWLSLCVVSLDRSLSVFLLCYIDEYGVEYNTGMTNEQIDVIMEDVFVQKYEMVDRRFDEQITSGNIDKIDEHYLLTNRGKWFVKVFRFVGDLYNVDKRFIYPNISGEKTE